MSGRALSQPDLQNGKFHKLRQKEGGAQEDGASGGGPALEEKLPVIAEENFEGEMTEALRKCTVCLQKFFTFFIGAIVGMSGIQFFILAELSSSEYAKLAVELCAVLTFFTTVNAVGSANFLIVRLLQTKAQQQEGKVSVETKKLRILSYFVLICKPSPFPPPPLTAVVSLVAYVVSLYEPIRATELAFRK